jgi:hypothetical protein
VLRARVHHRRRGCCRFFVFVVQVGCRGQQSDREGARNHREPDGQEGSRGHARGEDTIIHASPGNARTTAYAAPDNGCGAKISTVHASSDNGCGSKISTVHASPDNRGGITVAHCL